MLGVTDGVSDGTLDSVGARLALDGDSDGTLDSVEVRLGTILGLADGVLVLLLLPDLLLLLDLPDLLFLLDLLFLPDFPDLLLFSELLPSTLALVSFDICYRIETIGDYY